MKLYYYILCDPDKPNVTKVGISKNPKQRLKTYRTSSPKCYFLSEYTLPDKRHEKKILNELRGAFRVISEVVYADPRLVKNVVESYFSDHDIEFGTPGQI